MIGAFLQSGVFMKFQALVLSALVSIVSGASAHAYEGAAASSSLYEFNLDPNVYSYGEPFSGSVGVDASAGKVSLFVAFAMNCPVGMICPAVLPMPIEVELPIVSQTQDLCGLVTTVAFRDLRPVDGLLEKITIQDYAAVTCKYLKPAPVEVIYETRGWNRFDATEFKTRSTFKGQEFVSLF
jgi:hypothetical protein